METLAILEFSVKILKDYERNNYPFVYCVLKWDQHVYCSRNYEISMKDWITIVSQKSPVQMQFTKSHNLFKLQLWNYDTKQKIGQTQITSNDLTTNQRQKQFSINDRKIHLKFIYDRKNKIDTARDSQSSNLRVNYNKSDSNLKITKPSSAYVKKPINQQQCQMVPIPRYDPSTYGKWKFVPAKIQSNCVNKLKL